MKCEECGCSNTKENPVYKAPDPYAEEINDDSTEVWKCDKCRHESLMEI